MTIKISDIIDVILFIMVVTVLGPLFLIDWMRENIKKLFSNVGIK